MNFVDAIKVMELLLVVKIPTTVEQPGMPTPAASQPVVVAH